MSSTRLQARHLEHGVVAARPDQMYGWAGITRVKAQEILVSTNERKYHVCPFGREVIIRSLDGGRTWQLPQEVYNSELDDRDCNLVTMPDGTIILIWFTTDAFTQKLYLRPEWQARADRVTQRMRDELIGSWLLRSFDHLYEWEDKPDMGYPVSVELEPGQVLTVYYCSRQASIHLFHEKKVEGSTPEGLLCTRFRLE